MRALAIALLAGAAVGPAAAAPVDSSTVYLATIVSMTRIVRVQMTEGAQAEAATAGEKLPEGATVLTLENAKCEIHFTQAHYVRLAPSSRLKIARMERKKGARVLLQLLVGRVKAVIDRSLGEEAEFGVYGHTTITAVKGTDYDFMRDDQDIETVLVNDGRINIAELKSEKPEDIEKIFMMLLLGRIGIDMRSGKMMKVTPGSLFPSPVPIPPGFPSPWGDGSGGPGGPPKKPGPPHMPGFPGFGMP